ncbi:MAG TPA: hypothetical protein VFI39_06680 [Gemmatimonadales bacterium]|nr:hypothetical protein [Gemmatimonadales bacterium]
MSMRRANPWMVAAMAAASMMAAAPAPDRLRHMPAWLQMDARRRKKKPSRLGPRAPTRPSNPLRAQKNAVRRAFEALTGRRLSGRQWVRVRKRKECYVAFALWYRRENGRTLTPAQYSQMNRLAAVMEARAKRSTSDQKAP